MGKFSKSEMIILSKSEKKIRVRVRVRVRVTPSVKSKPRNLTFWTFCEVLLRFPIILGKFASDLAAWRQ